jgi:DNA-binding transcriptional MerR regulator
MSAMRARGITLAEIDKYLMARRAEERNETVGRPHPATHDPHKATNAKRRTAHAS